MTRQCWLVSDGNVFAAAEMAETRRERNRGLLGRPSIEGAMVLPATHWVHSIGMQFDLDVAHLDATGTVVRVEHLRRNRIGRPVLNAATVVEAAAGSFERWGLRVGTLLEVRE